MALPYLESFNKKKKDENIEVTIIDNSLEYLKDENNANRLVEYDKAENDPTVNPNAKYLAAKNSNVKKETIARLDDQFKNTQPKKAKGTQSEAKPEPKPKAEKQVAKKEKIEPKLFDSGFDAYASLNKKQNENKQAFNDTRRGSSENGSTGEESTATDRLKDVDQSLMTQLNTREYKYYGYYTRIRTQLNQWWQPKVREKVSLLLNKGRRIASDENKNTKVIIVLNDVGNLVGVQVLSVSGVKELDDAAVEAFRRAAPFPNPPKGLVEADGTIKIRWDFIVES